MHFFFTTLLVSNLALALQFSGKMLIHCIEFHPGAFFFFPLELLYCMYDVCVCLIQYYLYFVLNFCFSALLYSVVQFRRNLHDFGIVLFAYDCLFKLTVSFVFCFLIFSFRKMLIFLFKEEVCYLIQFKQDTKDKLYKLIKKTNYNLYQFQMKKKKELVHKCTKNAYNDIEK